MADSIFSLANRNTSISEFNRCNRLCVDQLTDTLGLLWFFPVFQIFANFVFGGLDDSRLMFLIPRSQDVSFVSLYCNHK